MKWFIFYIKLYIMRKENCSPQQFWSYKKVTISETAHYFNQDKLMKLYLYKIEYGLNFMFYIFRGWLLYKTIQILNYVTL